MITITVRKNQTNNQYGVYLAIDKETQLIGEFNRIGDAMCKMLALGGEIPFARQRVDEATAKVAGSKPDWIEVI